MQRTAPHLQVISSDKKETTERYWGIGFVILSAVLFGVMPIFARYIYAGGGNAVTLVFHRFFFSAPCLYLLTRRLTKERISITGQEFSKLLLLALGFVATPLLLFASYVYVSVGTATTLHFVYPVLVLIGCIVFYRDPVSRVQMFCCLLCCCGILLFYTPGDRANFAGVCCALLSGVTYAFFIVYLSKSNLQHMHPYKLNFHLSLVGTIVLIAAALASGTLRIHLTPKAWFLSILFSIMSSVFAAVFFQRGAKIVSSQSASMLSTFEPLTSIVLGATLLNEAIGARELTGIGCILVSVSILTIFDQQSQKDLRN